MQAYEDEQLFTTLKELQVIDAKKLQHAFDDSRQQKVPLESILLDRDLISDENLARTLAEITSFPLARLAEISIDAEILQTIPEVVARKQKTIAFKKDQKGLHVAMVNPTNIEIIGFLEKKVGLPVIVYITTERDFANALFLYSKDISTTFEDIIQANIKDANLATGKQVDPPIIKIVDTILNYAYQNRASDIHIEPFREHSLVRFRIDGIMHDILSLPQELHAPIVTRIKVISDLRTDEHQVAQDGKLQFKRVEEDVDVRVSIVPITTGEKIVMRLLSERSRQFSLVDLGFSEHDLTKARKAYEKPYGMVLATGPTGSGKTTTIYSVLKLLNTRDVNIMTIEDPVEYEIPGVNQIQVNIKAHLTFAEGLRSIVRQDPNIILVGEIRDEETADIAINSAMTGHLVLSTLHTNDSATSIPRLLDMGVEPFLVASTANIIIAQRLVRKIHSKCRISHEVDIQTLSEYFDAGTIKKVFGTAKTARLYQGKGCQIDHDTGYEGRIGIFECLIVDEEVQQAILDRKDATTIRKIAVKNGMKTMMEDGLEKVKEGLTTMEEVIRVTKE